jgi:hypothetical protein
MPKRMDMLTEQVNLGNLPVYWQRVAEPDEQADRAMQSWRSMQFTARFLDEAQPAGPRTYIGVMRLLNIAIDNQEALQSLIATRRVTHCPNGTYCGPYSRRPSTQSGYSTSTTAASAASGASVWRS